MDSVPRSAKEESKNSLRIPADGHGGNFFQFGWVDELPPLLYLEQLPQTTYRGPILAWPTLSVELKKGLHALHNEQELFEDVWKDACKKAGPKTITEDRRRNSELSPYRMRDAVFERLLNQRLKPKEASVPRKTIRFGIADETEDESDDEDYNPYSLAMMAQILCEKSESALHEHNGNGDDVEDENQDSNEDGVV